MARADDGEFELILGNRQLLSVFFVVVMLLGVFFAMGYIVGKSSIPAEAKLANKSGPIIVDPKNPRSSYESSPAGSQPAPENTAAIRPVPGAEPRSGEPRPAEVRSEPRPSEAKPPIETRTVETRPGEAAKSVAETKSRPESSARKEEHKPVRQEEPQSSNEPAPGKAYLQVVASTRPDCEIIVDVLKRKGFSALIAPGPSDKLFRVLVGPLNDTAAIAKVRADLEQAGFQKPYLRKY